MSNYIYSTMSNSQSVVIYESYPGSKNDKNNEGSSNPSIRKSVVHINGGANVNATGIDTPKGVVTEVNDSQLKALRETSHFKRWEEKGFVTVETKLDDADNVAKNMEAKDNSAQITLDDHEERFEKGDTSAAVDVEKPKARRGRKKS